MACRRPHCHLSPSTVYGMGVVHQVVLGSVDTGVEEWSTPLIGSTEGFSASSQCLLNGSPEGRLVALIKGAVWRRIKVCSIEANIGLMAEGLIRPAVAMRDPGLLRRWSVLPELRMPHHSLDVLLDCRTFARRLLKGRPVVSFQAVGWLLRIRRRVRCRQFKGCRRYRRPDCSRSRRRSARWR